MKTLDELAIEHGTDKSSLWNGYTQYYERMFASRREESLKLLEIGVYKGASLRMWADYFPNAEIIGMDIQKPLDLGHPRIHTIQADQGNWSELEHVQKELNGVDIIIDDGSHRPNHVSASFSALFYAVNSGGYYVIEDLACSFLPDVYGPSAGLGNPFNMIEKLKRYLDVIHADPDHGGSLGDGYTQYIRSMTHFPLMCFIERGDPRNGVGRLSSPQYQDIWQNARDKRMRWMYT